MFTKEIIESLFFIAVLAAAIVWYGVAAGRKEDREAGSRTDTSEQGHQSHKKTA